MLASSEDQTKVDAQLIQVLRSAARLQFLVSSKVEPTPAAAHLPADSCILQQYLAVGQLACGCKQVAIMAVLANSHGQLNSHQQLCLYSMQVTLLAQHDCPALGHACRESAWHSESTVMSRDPRKNSPGSQSRHRAGRVMRTPMLGGSQKQQAACPETLQ